MNKLLTSVMGAFAFASMAIIPSTQIAQATAHSYTLSIPIERYMKEEPGSSHLLATEAVDAKFQGLECDVVANSWNQHSVHPGNNMIIASGNSSVTLFDIEREAGVTTDANGVLTVDGDITVTIKLGSDGKTSAGMNVELTCEEPQVEVCRDGKIETVYKSEVLATDTDAPCPENTVSVCRDGVVLNDIKESDVLSTDTEAPCPENTVDVCRDGKVLENIKESEVLSTDTEAPCPEVKSEKTIKVCRNGEVIDIKPESKLDSDIESNVCPDEGKGTGETPVELPKTGAGSSIAIITSAMAAAGGLSHVVIRRK